MLIRRARLFLKVVLVVSNSKYEWVKNANAPDVPSKMKVSTLKARSVYLTDRAWRRW